MKTFPLISPRRALDTALRALPTTINPIRLGTLIGLAGAAIALGGCDLTDPYLREGMWRPVGVNETNRQLMVARPSDLVLGRGTVDSDGETAAVAIDRLRADKVRKLPSSSISGQGSGSSSGS